MHPSTSPRHPLPVRRRGGALAAGLWAGALLGGLAGPAHADDPSLAAVRRRLEEADPAVRAAAVRRLAGAVDPASVQTVVGVLSDPHPYVRRAAAGVLGVVLDGGVRTRLLREGPGWKDGVARGELVATFAAWGDRDGRTGLLRAVADRPTVTLWSVC